VAELERSLNVLATRVADVVARLQAAERESLRNDQMAALGQLAAGLAHELRNPLTAIRTLVEAARGQGPGGRLDARDLEVLDEEIGRLDTTLQSFLDYARPPRLEQRSVDLRDVVRKTVQLVGPRAERQSIQLDVALPDEPLTAFADAEQLRQVLLNLLLNALDAIRTGGSVTLQAARDPAAGQIVLKVLDDGPGIPDSVREKLFEPFVSSKTAGTGLGLTISRRIVENHGGTITAEDRPEGGAVFTVRLPQREVPAGEAAMTRERQGNPAPLVGCGRPLAAGQTCISGVYPKGV
jgi:signal transduction histidine kinase